MASAFGLATVCAAYEAGLLAVDGPQVLVVVANAAVPEDAAPLADVDGVAALTRRFDAVHHLNAAVAPHHPRRWRPPEDDLPGWRVRLRRLWDLGDADVSLLTESVAGEPALVQYWYLPAAGGLTTPAICPDPASTKRSGPVK